MDAIFKNVMMKRSGSFLGQHCICDSILSSMGPCLRTYVGVGDNKDCVILPEMYFLVKFY